MSTQRRRRCLCSGVTASELGISVPEGHTYRRKAIIGTRRPLSAAEGILQASWRYVVCMHTRRPSHLDHGVPPKPAECINDEPVAVTKPAGYQRHQDLPVSGADISPQVSLRYMAGATRKARQRLANVTTAGIGDDIVTALLCTYWMRRG